MAARYVRIGQYPDYRDEIRGTLSEILASTANPGTYAAPEDVAGCTLEMGDDGLWTGASVGALTQVQADDLVASGALATVKVGTPAEINGTHVRWTGTAWQVRSSVTVSITDFGADPTYAFDSSDAILKAIIASSDVYVPAGIYKVSRVSLYNISGLKLHGPGTLKLPDIIQPATSLLSIKEGSHSITIDGVTFDGNKGNGPGLDVCLIDCQTNDASNHDIRIKNCTLKNNNYEAIRLSDVTRLWVEDNYIQNTDVGIDIAGCTDYTVKGNCVSGGTSEALAIWSYSGKKNYRGTVSGNSWGKNCTLEGAVAVAFSGNVHESGWSFVAGCVTESESILIANEVFRGSGSCEFRGVVPCKNVKISNCLFDAGTSIKAKGVDGLTVDGNTFNIDMPAGASVDTNGVLFINGCGVYSALVTGNHIRLKYSANAPNNLTRPADLKYFLFSYNYVEVSSGMAGQSMYYTGSSGEIVDVIGNTSHGVRAGFQFGGSFLPNRFERNTASSPSFQTFNSASPVAWSFNPCDISYVEISGSGTISTIPLLGQGTEVRMKFQSTATVNSSGNLVINGGSFTAIPGAIITLRSVGNKWVECGRVS